MRLRRSGGSEPAGMFTPANARRLIEVGKVLVPVLLPVVLRAATVVRGWWTSGGRAGSGWRPVS